METITKTTAELRRELLAERVERGVALLDREMPDWWVADREKPIDLNHLDLASGGWCVLGQLEDPCGEAAYVDMVSRLLGPSWPNVDTDYGFHSDHDPDFPILTDLWREVIGKRRANA